MPGHSVKNSYQKRGLSWHNLIPSGSSKEVKDKFKNKPIPQELFNLFGGKLKTKK